jgi:hypothetical protein
MADVNKSVEISYRADIKQLLANLKQMPGITEKQAKEMVSGLNKQLRQAERAAAKAAKTTVKSFDQMGKAANRASVSARGLRKDFANIDRLSSEASQALMVFSPALGEAAASASTFAGAAESAGRALMVSNPLFLAAAVAAGVAFVAYQQFTGEAERLEESQKRVAEMTEKANKAFEAASDAAQDAENKIASLVTETNDLRNELALMQGIITDTEFLELTNAQKLLDFEDKLRDQTEQRILKLQEAANIQAELVRSLNAESRAIKENQGIFESNVENNEKRRTIIKQSNEALDQYNKLQQQINEEEQNSEQLIESRLKEQEELLNLQLELKKQAEAEQRREEQRKAALKAQKEELKKQREEQKKLEEIQRLGLEAAQQKQQLDDKNFLAMAKIVGKEQEIAASKKLQIEALEEQISKAQELSALAQAEATTEEQKLAAQQVELETQALIAEAKQAMIVAELEAEKQLQKLREEGSKKALKNSADLRKQELQTAHELFNATSDFAMALGDLQQTANKQNKESAYRLFRFSQAAAVGDIAFSVAKGIAEAASLPPILRGAQIATIVATGAAQTASVMAQQPPTADMGMIGNSDPLRPDERMVRVLKGESILDRATTASLGEDGVRALSSGGAMQPQVIVMQPFKHFDRYVQRNKAGGGSLSQASSRIRY